MFNEFQVRKSHQNLMTVGLDFHPVTMVMEVVVEGAGEAAGPEVSSFLAFLLF